MKPKVYEAIIDPDFEAWLGKLDALIRRTTQFSSRKDIDEKFGPSDWEAMFECGRTSEDALEYVLEESAPIWGKQSHCCGASLVLGSRCINGDPQFEEWYPRCTKCGNETGEALVMEKEN